LKYPTRHNMATGAFGQMTARNRLPNRRHCETNARDAAIILSFALQHGANICKIAKALCRDSKGRALGPIGAALDRIAKDFAP
jgi:hypothetical protein